MMSELMTLSSRWRSDNSDFQPQVITSGRLLCEVAPGSAAVGAISEFIRRRFEQSYGARPNLSIPQLLALINEKGTLLAAVGARHADRERLFLEDYLDEPVEAYLAQEPGVARSHIVEIAHLAGVEPGVSRPLFLGLALWLVMNLADWIVFTGTEPLRNSFRRLGIDCFPLAKASADRLPGRGAGWGSYYAQSPMVMAANVKAGYQNLRTAGLLNQTQWLSAGTERAVSNG
ncbi:thermostable hemolysin [Marinobacter halotolerans]|uniref:thermostable hemolysin n=1 Tax=Marinobacter halotolerans TaxID=1569211 RepID=UPI001248E614|nr:thermostable hemolysin [Marinobacter halotolerans]